ncbi:MAG: efflux RND transporter periplasmic adaptor subunit [bacterium]|nr:efflux RND transporter periplasmic adaptor subunit [bacterium]
MKRRIVWINITLALVLAGAVVGGYFWLFHSTAEATTGRTVAVQSGTVSETVTATGSVETAGTVDLSFTQGGTVDSLRVKAGDTVEAGERLATQDDATAKSSLTSAKRSYAQAVTAANQSSLSLQSGQRSVTDAQNTAKLNKKSNQLTLDNAKQDLADAKSSWSTSCLDPNGSCPSTDAWSQLRSAEAEVTNAKTAYDQAVQTASADETTNNLKVNQSATNVASTQAKQTNDCNTYGSSSTQCTSANDSLRNAQQSYDNTVNSQKVAAIQSQQSLVNADARITSANVSLKKLQASLAKQAQDSIEAAQKSVDAAQLAMKKSSASDQESIVRAQESLASLQAGAASVDTGAGSTTADDAAIDVAREGIKSANAALDETVLRAPVSGVVGTVTVEDGQTTAAGTPVLTLIPDASYEVVANFSEADALKVAVGQPATVTFDALSGEDATGTVTAVDILPTTGGDVTTYGATITLDDVPDTLRDGMSASVVVTVDEATGVLWAPSAAVSTVGGVSTVTVRKDGVDSTVAVTTGLAGDSGTEITSGVAEGDQLVISTTDSSGGFGGFPGGGIPGGGGGLGGGAGPAISIQGGP